MAIEPLTKLATTSPRVIIVDDDQAYVDRFVQKLTTAYSVRCDVAYSSFALRKLLQSNPEKILQRLSAIFVDLHMEDDFSGFRALKWLREKGGFKSVPVIMISHSKLDADVAQAYRMGATSYVHKPVNLVDIEKMIDDVAGYWCFRNISENILQEGTYSRGSIQKTDTGHSYELAIIPNLSQYKNRARWSNSKIARTSGIDIATVAKALKEQPVSVGELIRIARALDGHLDLHASLLDEIVRLKE